MSTPTIKIDTSAKLQPATVPILLTNDENIGCKSQKRKRRVAAPKIPQQRAKTPDLIITNPRSIAKIKQMAAPVRELYLSQTLQLQNFNTGSGVPRWNKSSTFYLDPRKVLDNYSSETKSKASNILDAPLDLTMRTFCRPKESNRRTKTRENVKETKPLKRTRSKSNADCGVIEKKKSLPVKRTSIKKVVQRLDKPTNKIAEIESITKPNSDMARPCQSIFKSPSMALKTKLFTKPRADGIPLQQCTSKAQSQASHFQMLTQKLQGAFSLPHTLFKPPSSTTQTRIIATPHGDRAPVHQNSTKIPSQVTPSNAIENSSKKISRTTLGLSSSPLLSQLIAKSQDATPQPLRLPKLPPLLKYPHISEPGPAHQEIHDLIPNPMRYTCMALPTTMIVAFRTPKPEIQHTLQTHCHLKLE